MMVNEKDRLGKPFYLDTDLREKDTEKHSFGYMQDLLRTIGSQMGKLRIIMGEEDVLTPSQWQESLKDIR